MPTKRILFVDDERPVLEGIRQRFHRSQPKWDMKFAESGAQAIEQFNSGPIDVLVTDIRMPVMGGAQLLEVVSQRWPQVARIVLSGYAVGSELVQLVPLAHRYLAKPCEPDQLERVIDQCTRIQDVLHAPLLQLAAGKIRRFPAIPAVYQKLTAAISREDVDTGEVAAIISKDIGITAKILQVVNSAFFRLPRRVATVEQAVAHLGTNAVRNLVLSAEVFSAQQQERVPAGMETEKLQAHAWAVAAGARALAGGTSWSDDAMLAGLLHDIGHWVLLQQCPEEMEEVCRISRARNVELHIAEREVLGTTHAELGAYLLGLWGFPYPVLEAIAFHHQPQLASAPEFGILAAVTIAESLADPVASVGQNGFGARTGAEYLSTLELPFAWPEAERRVAAAINEAS